jgi:phosphatidate phosphatase PAH1
VNIIINGNQTDLVMKVGKEGEGYFIEKVLKLNESDIEEDTPTDSYFRHFAA